jgi:phage replication O-like protein O
VADVQLEKGHVRIANALNRALIVARFSDVQRRVVHLLIDQTFGWQRKTVEMSIPELAAMLDMKASGGFREAITDLVHAGVVQLVRGGSGRTRSVFAVQKDHEQWGKFSVASAFLV